MAILIIRHSVQKRKLSVNQLTNGKASKLTQDCLIREFMLIPQSAPRPSLEDTEEPLEV